MEADKIRTELGINYHMVRKESADPKLAVSCGPHCRNTIMKLTKNAAALLLAASLAVSVCATPVFAAEGGGTTTTPPKMGSQEVNGSNNTPGGPLLGSYNTQVLYKVTESYTWTVPITIDFGVNAGVNNFSTVEARLDNDKNGEQAKQESGGTEWKGTAPKVCVTKNIIGVNKNLQIAIDTTTGGSYDDTEGFFVEAPETLKDGGSPTKYEKLYFTITKPATATGDPEVKLTKTENKVLSVPSGTNTANQELVFKLKTTSKSAEMAGTYEGHVVFYSEIV